MSLRDDLVAIAASAIDCMTEAIEVPFPSDHTTAEAVLDSVPPNTFKNEKEEWVKLEPTPDSQPAYELTTAARASQQQYQEVTDAG